MSDPPIIRILLVFAGLLALAATSAHAQTTASPAQQLAERYAPVLLAEPQLRACGPGEPYRPTRVDIVLGRQGVVLRNPAQRVVKAAPTAVDLFGHGEGYYLDFPGDPLKPGCIYERDFRAWNGNLKPVVYAHVATDAAHPGKLAVEYWFWYTFNDFTGKHEGDWEMAQVDFTASTAEEALSRGPYQIDLSQHAGGERLAWNDRVLRKEGTHPLIYDATGSHANYFGRALYLGRSASEGFGCDDTRRATERVSLETILLPDPPSSVSAPYSWLAFHGRWGQKEKGFNNGPTGPATKEQWTHPIAWADGLRDGSVTVPGTKTLGPTVTNFFCDAVTQSSVALNWGLVHPLPFLMLLVIVPLAGLAAARRTSWRPPRPYPVRAHRAGGQMLGAAGRLYSRDLRTFVTLGAVFIPVSLLTEAVQWVLFHLTGLGSFVALDGKQGAVTALFALLIGDVGAAFATVLTTAAVAVALKEMADDRRVTGGQALRAALHRLRPLAAATVIQYGIVLLLTVTIVGIPLALHRFIRWSLFTQACMLEDRTGRGSLARSSQLVGGRWWRTFVFTVVVDLLALLSGLIFGIALLLATARSLNFIDIASSLVYTLTVPFAAIALTLYYFDLAAPPEASGSREV